MLNWWYIQRPLGSSLNYREHNAANLVLYPSPHLQVRFLLQVETDCDTQTPDKSIMKTFTSATLHQVLRTSWGIRCSGHVASVEGYKNKPTEHNTLVRNPDEQI